MVVILLIGLAASAVVLSLPAGPDAAREAEALAARMAAARTLAIASNRATALVLEPGGYRFEQRGAGGWEAAGADRPGRGGFGGGGLGRTRLPDGLGVEMAADGPGERRLVFDPTGLATPATLALGPARIAVSASGDIRLR
jgi:type II secretory pathway pseudopilin PulG